MRNMTKQRNRSFNKSKNEAKTYKQDNVIENGVKKKKSKEKVNSASTQPWIKIIGCFSGCSFVALLVAVLYVLFNETKMELHWEENSKKLESGIAVESHQHFSLRKPYSVDYGEIIRVRRENMQKYNYAYNMFGIDKRAGLSLQEFWDIYDGKWPVVVTDIVPKWKAMMWSGKYFNDTYGDQRIAMKAVSKGLHNAETLALPLHLFYKNVQKADKYTWTYVEDELFIPLRPELRSHIGENIYMDEDYFTLFPKEVRPWNAMLLWGTKFSRSSLHIDPYNWTGTNAVFSGRKRWRLYPPGQDFNLYIREQITSGFPLDCYKYNSMVDAYEPNLQAFPNFKKATAIEFDQLPGEILFLPTGWYHQAFNVEETIAVSSQMTNRNNFRIVLEEVLKVENVKREDLPKNIDILSPPDQVKAVMNLIPQKLLDRGKAITEDIIQQVQSIEKPKPRTVL